MYPYIVIDGIKIYFVNIWILLSIAFYLFLIYKFSKKYQLDFWRYFSYFWIVLVFTFLFGIYFGVIFTFKEFVPSLSQIIFIIKNQWYNFIWLSLGFFIWHLIFLKKIPLVAEKLKRIDVVFYSLMISLFVLWIFLLLGDNFIGRPTDSAIWVSAINFCSWQGVNCFMPKTQLAAYKKVYPVWIFLSIVSLFSFIVIVVLHSLFKNKVWFGLVGFVLFLFLLNFVFIFQKYPRYLVIKPFKQYEIRIDIKNYRTIILAFFLIFYYIFLVSHDEYRKIKKNVSSPKRSK